MYAWRVVMGVMWPLGVKHRVSKRSSEARAPPSARAISLVMYSRGNVSLDTCRPSRDPRVVVGGAIPLWRRRSCKPVAGSLQR